MSTLISTYLKTIRSSGLSVTSLDVHPLSDLNLSLVLEIFRHRMVTPRLSKSVVSLSRVPLSTVLWGLFLDEWMKLSCFRDSLTCVLAVDPCEDVDPREGEFGCRWWAQLPFSLSLSLRPTKDGLGMCQESGLAATAVVAGVASIWNQRKSTWSFDCISDNVAPITLLRLARMSSTCNRVSFICRRGTLLYM